MSTINVLDKRIYNRISAGEVVERPYSVVKELLENSIDAGATEISVSIVDGGTTEICVKDNGSGIEKSELFKAIMPHATSKIAEVKDLDKILTLGFRGEALASICAVSKLTIISKPPKQNDGAKLYCEGGDNPEVQDYPCEDGTTITVNNLFYNTPARAKFLKPAKSEEGDITNIISRLILANPTISIKYVADGKTVFQSYGDGLKNALINVYGVEAYNNCFEISTEKNGLKIEGYIGKHFYTKSNRTYQTLILNGRYITNSTTSSAVQNAYGSYLMKRQYPFYVLCVKMSPEFVDVNVHPNKIDVRFVNNQVVYGALYSVISKVLDGSSQAIDIVVDSGNNIPTKPLEEKPIETPKIKYDENRKYDTSLPPKFKYAEFHDSGSFGEEEKEDTNVSSSKVDIFAENKAYIEKLQKIKEEENAQKIQERLEIDEELKYVGRVLNTYLILEKGDSVYFIDQHAAHERLIFDKLTESRNNNSIVVQPLLVPYTLNVNTLETQIIVEKMDYFKELGFNIEQTSVDSFNVYEIPYEFAEINFKEFFDDIIGDNSFKKEQTPMIIKEKLMQKACKSAIKAGYVLSQSEIDALIKRLNGNLGLKCPHGRPIACKITRTEIDKWFKRIV